MIDQISTSEWIQLKTETRNELRRMFNIPKSSHTETITDATGHGRLISDGTTYKDLEVMTFEKLKGFVSHVLPEDNIHTLFVKAVFQIENPTNGIEMLKVPEEVKAPQKEIIPSDVLEDGKCEKCEFKTASKVAMKMHVGRFHKTKVIIN